MRSVRTCFDPVPRASLPVLLLWSILTAGEPPDRLLDSGRVDLVNKRPGAASEYFLRAIEVEPRSIPAHRAYQDARLAMGDTATQELRERYRMLLAVNTGDPLYLYLYGRCLECEKGIAYFDTALQADKCYTWALVGRGVCLFDGGDAKDAKEDFLRAIKCDPDFGVAYRNLAQVYETLGSTTRAKKTFRKLIAQDRTNPQAYEWLGDMYLGQKRYKYAAMAYQKAVANGTSSASLFFRLGYANFECGRYPHAMAAYQKSIELGNDTYEVYYNLATAQELAERTEEALDNYEVAYRKCGDYRLLYSMGNCAVMLGLHTKALESYGEFLEKEPKNTEAMLGLANAYQLKQDYESAIRTYQRILEIDEGCAKAYYNLGSIYAYHLKDMASMRQYWDDFVKRFPDHRDADFIKREMEKLASVQ